jgi:hypothetical protein
MQRQELTRSKSPVELSQISSLSEFPIPKNIENMMSKKKDVDDSISNFSSVELLRSPSKAKSVHELSATIYDSLPQSLKEPVAVRSKIEDPELQQQRFELTRSKTPSQLAEMHTLGDIPIKGLWEGDRGRPSHRRSLSARSSSIPRNKQELKDMLYNKMLPDSLKVPVVVRVCNEDPEVLRKHQEIQQSKSVHELSKISNLNELPLPINIQLPDVPLPSLKSLIGVIARVPKKKPKPNPVIEHEDNNGGLYSTVSTPNPDRTYTDDEMLRYDMSTPGGDASHRDQDFGYEVIGESSSPLNARASPQCAQPIPEQYLQEDIPDHGSPQSAIEEDSIAEQYRGTPPMKSKKKKPDRRSQSHEVSDHVQLGDEIPPPLPPKRPSSVRRELRESPLAAAAGQVSKSSSSSRVPGGSSVAHDEFLSCADDPMLNPSSIRHSGSGHSFVSARSGVSNIPDQFHSIASTLHSGTLVDSNNMLRRDDDENTLAESIVDSMHSCADTMVTTGEDDAALHSCADTLAESDDEIDQFRDSPTPPLGSG